MLFSDPQTHAQNPPSSWEIVKLYPRWVLTTAMGIGTLETFATKRDALAAKESGFLFDLYYQEGRWMAGDDVAGWKPWSETEGGREWLAANPPMLCAWCENPIILARDETGQRGFAWAEYGPRITDVDFQCGLALDHQHHPMAPADIRADKNADYNARHASAPDETFLTS